MSSIDGGFVASMRVFACNETAVNTEAVARLMPGPPATSMAGAGSVKPVLFVPGHIRIMTLPRTGSGSVVYLYRVEVSHDVLAQGHGVSVFNTA